MSDQLNVLLCIKNEMPLADISKALKLKQEKLSEIIEDFLNQSFVIKTDKTYQISLFGLDYLGDYQMTIAPKTKESEKPKLPPHIQVFSDKDGYGIRVGKTQVKMPLIASYELALNTAIQMAKMFAAKKYSTIKFQYIVFGAEELSYE